MEKVLNYLVLPYPAFTLGQIIDPEEANMNNSEIESKLNDYIDELGVVVDALKAPSGASEIGAGVVGLTGANIQQILDALKAYVDAHKSNTANPHNVTAGQLGVYTKAEIDPYIRGGDTLIKYEVFTVTTSNNGNGTFNYMTKDGQLRTGTITPEGYQVFTLEKGSYNLNENRISATINDTLQRSKASGGIVEIDTTHVALTQPEGNGAEITFMYFERIGITGIGVVQYGETQPTAEAVWFKVVG